MVLCLKNTSVHWSHYFKCFIRACGWWRMLGRVQPKPVALQVLWDPAVPKPAPGIWWALGKVCRMEGKNECSPGAVNRGLRCQQVYKPPRSQELGLIPRRKRSAFQAGSPALVPGHAAYRTAPGRGLQLPDPAGHVALPAFSNLKNSDFRQWQRLQPPVIVCSPALIESQPERSLKLI